MALVVLDLRVPRLVPSNPEAEQGITQQAFAADCIASLQFHGAVCFTARRPRCFLTQQNSCDPSVDWMFGENCCCTCACCNCNASKSQIQLLTGHLMIMSVCVSTINNGVLFDARRAHDHQFARTAGNAYEPSILVVRAGEPQLC